MKDNISSKQLTEFLSSISKLEIGEVIGVSRILNVKLLNEETNEARDGQEIIVDMAEAFSKLNHVQRRNLMVIIKAAMSGKKKSSKKKKKK